jgi:hypothetical protein
MKTTRQTDAGRHTAAPPRERSRPARKEQEYDLTRGWAGKTLAGVLCGLAIALIASGLFMLPNAKENMVYDKYQIAMWIVPPIWLAVLSCCYLFRDALRAWLWLGGITVAGFALFKGLAG